MFKMILLITYDLKAPGRDYAELHAAIKANKTWWHHLESVWLVDTEETPKQWYERLKPLMDSNDSLFIIEVKDNYFGYLPERAWTWLDNRDFSE